MISTATAISKLLKTEHLFRLIHFLELTSYMWPEPAAVKNHSSYDFVIVGGGTAGCLIASRLAQCNASVLLIEAGGQPPIETMLPGEFRFTKGSQLDWNFTSPYNEYASESHNDGVASIQQGHVLGGSGQVNYMLYGKGIPEDYDKWAEIANDSSWKFKNVCKIFKHIEDVVDEEIRNSPDVMFHGTEGKIKIKKYDESKFTGYFQAYREMGQKTVLDINPNNTLGYTSPYFNIYNRLRRGTAYSYLSPEKDYNSLSVIYHALATKILFDENKKACGVEILRRNGTTITVRANKEVILSAGVIKTPHILLLSGVGPEKHLKENKIKVISNLSQVGQNLQDHPCVISIYKMGKSEPEEELNPNEFTVTVMEGYVAVNKNQDHADYQIFSTELNSPELFAQACASIYFFNYEICDSIAKAGEGRQLHFVTNSLLYPETRGEILLKNCNPKANPIILSKCHSNENDVINHARYLEHYNRIINTNYFRNLSAELIHPTLKKCEKLKKSSMEYWKCYAKSMTSSMHMYFGTCAMGSVVNSKLQVKGVKNLRIADASIIPTSVGSGLQATVMMIAEKLFLMLKEHHNL